MATSGTYTFRLDIQETIIEAYERAGYDAQVLTGYEARRARRSLNLLFTEWATRGITYWTTTETTLSLVESTASYTLPVGTVDIIDAVIRRSSTDTSMTRISLTDYNSFPNKDTEGLPTQYFFDRQYTPQIYVWPVPENSTDTIVYWQLSQVEDVDASNQDSDVPYRWAEAMCAGLALKLYTKVATIDPVRLAVLQQQYSDAFTFAADDEGERATLQITPTAVVI